jgi:C4-dicarboxylate-specific signal transduction histidine kinase
MKLLLVDDEEIVFKAVGGFLSRCGHQVSTALNGSEALEEMGREVPDVVLSDIRMPEMDGLALLEVVSVRYPTVPVILITGHGDVDTAVSALQRGAYDYIRKPVKLDELVSLLERVEERKRLEQTLVEERAKLVHAGRLATVGTMAAGIAHEINNPTTAIRGNLQTFERLWQRAEPALQTAVAQAGDRDLQVLVEEFPGLVAAMLAGTERITRIVSAVRLYARTDENRAPQEVDLAKCIEEALSLTASVCEGIAVRSSLASVRVLGVAQELTQVVVNLVQNAVQALADRAGGVVSVDLRRDDAGWVVLSVADNGPGVPESLHERIFDPFFTTKEPGSGIGLGLSICHGIVTDHRGTIGFAPVPGGGARFEVKLPPVATA